MTRSGALHVLVVPAWWPSPEQPGAGVFHVDYARAFAEAGLRVGVVVPDLVSPRFLGKGTRIPLWPRLTEESLGGIPVIRIRGLHTALRMPALQMKRFAAWLRRGYIEYAHRHGRPDVLHAMCAVPAGWACTAIGGVLGRRVVITEHTGPFSLVMRKPAQAAYARAGLNLAAGVVAVSEKTRGEMIAEGVQREILVCGNPVSPLFTEGPIAGQGGPNTAKGQASAGAFLGVAHPSGGPDPMTTGSDIPAQRPVRGLFVGRMTREKGALDCLNAVLPVMKSPAGRMVEFRFIGDGPLAAEIRTRANAAGLGRRLTFPGHVSRERLRIELGQADFLVLPSHGESFGLAVAEALCVGLPVVTTRGTACADFVGRDDGIVVPPGDASALADAVRDLARTADAYDRAAIAQRARARFSRGAVAAWYADLFARVVAAVPEGGA